MLFARWTREELRAIATRALANGGEYSRGLLGEQLEAEERDETIPDLDVDESLSTD